MPLDLQSPFSAFDWVIVGVYISLTILIGIWANRADQIRGILEPGDIEEAMNAASNIGDDRLQKQSQGYVTPDSFTHGSSAQRVRWFNRGYTTGEVNSCNTFNTAEL